MTDSLLSYEEAADLARELFDELIDRDPDGARGLLGLPADAPIVIDEHLLRRLAWVGMLKRAIEVRCERDCGHSEQYAWLRFGILTCRKCAQEKFVDMPPRDGDGIDCDVCGASADPFAVIEHRIGRDGPWVLACACDACRHLWESLRLPPVPMSLN